MTRSFGPLAHQPLPDVLASVRVSLGRSWPRLLAAGLAVLTAGALGFWAGGVIATPATPSAQGTDAVLVAVTQQTVGRTLSLNVTVSQGRRSLAANTLSGVVTWTSSSGRKGQGAVLYRVADVPVRAIRGSMPFYRDLYRGAKGQDVRQLRDALVELGYLSTAGSVFDSATAQAVRAWQSALGMREDGVVRLGELVAVRVLPSLVVLDKKALAPGSLLHGGEEVVLGAAGNPNFFLELSADQAMLVPESATIVIPYKGQTWRAVIKDSETTEAGTTRLVLAATDGGAVCATRCELVTSTGDAYLPSKVQVVPPVAGPAIPVAAVTTNADGTTSVTVIDASGHRDTRVVRVLGSQDGVAVVEGLTIGEQVQVLAAESATSMPEVPVASATPSG